MNRIRNKLIAVFLAATIIPLMVTLWITTSLLERSLSYATTEKLDKLSKSLEETGREYYRQSCESLRQEVRAGSLAHQSFAAADRRHWPGTVSEFWDTGEPERFTLAGDGGSRLDYLVRHGDDVWVYTHPLGELRMTELTDEYRDARSLVEQAGARDLRRGFTWTLLVLVAAVWLISLLWLVYLANRMSQPIEQLTSGLSGLASGNLQVRIPVQHDDEIGRAITAFNTTAGELQQNRDRLVYLTQIASWQTLARKMAHELKNSLTPIRLTVEEIAARQSGPDRAFMQQAVQIVVNEVESLEKRVRAFSEFSSEPAVRPVALDLKAVMDERVAFLRVGHPDVTYDLDALGHLPPATADADRVKGILTNLLENAAEAAGAGGRVLSRVYETGGKLHIEVHDSGAGLSDEARRTLFEPTITFKSRGMGLGLSIARKDALVCGGDLLLIESRLGGAAFRLILNT